MFFEEKKKYGNMKKIQLIEIANDFYHNELECQEYRLHAIH